MPTRSPSSAAISFRSCRRFTFFSLSGAAGAALAGIAMRLGVGDTAHVAIAVAATGFAAFSLAMTAGRLAGDRVVGRLGAVRALRVSGGLAAPGFGAALVIGGADRGDRGVRPGGRGNREHHSRAVQLDRALRRW